MSLHYSEALEVVVKLMVSLNYEHSADDLLVSQARSSLEGILSM